jgi:SP family xylose:H+ symportor-like MFS transporter
MHKASQSKISTTRIASIAALGGFLFGFDTGVIGGAQLYFTEYFKLTPGQQGWAVGSALYGCLVGALFAGYLTKAISRKHTLILSAVLFCISAWGSGVAASLTELVIYRIIGGVGIGFASMAAPMYIAEISPAAQRGKMVSLYQLAIVFGFFSVFLTTYYIGGGNANGLTEQQLAEHHNYNLQQGWRIMFQSELLPAVVFLLMLFTVPHSPRWLMLKQREEEARKVLNGIYLNQPEVTERNLSDIKKSLSEQQITSVKLLLLAGLGFATFLGVMLSVLQQITGINAILYYGAEIFSNALGYGPQDALKQQVLLGVVNLIFTFVAMFTVDKWGRKPLYLAGTAGMFVGLTILFATIYLDSMGLISLLAILLFIASFAMSMGPVTWVILSEMFPNRARSLAMSVAVSAQWLFNAIVASSFPVINHSEFNQQQFNGAFPYLVFAFFCIVAFILIWRLLPETKGKTLEEIEMLW